MKRKGRSRSKALTHQLTVVYHGVQRSRTLHAGAKAAKTHFRRLAGMTWRAFKKGLKGADDFVGSRIERVV